MLVKLNRKAPFGSLAALAKIIDGLSMRRMPEVLGIPYERVMQVALIPVAHTIGTDFKPGRRIPTRERLHWDRW